MSETGAVLPPLAGPLAVLDPQARAELAALGTWHSFDAGDALMRQGGSSQDLHVIVAGRVRVVMSTVGGDELLVAILGPGETVGELSVLDGRPRSATVTAIESVRTLRIEGGAFGRFLLARPHAVIGLLRVLSARLRTADELRLQLTTAPTEQRLARCLLGLAAEHGDFGPGGVHISVRLSQADLASYIGASREAVNQALSGLRENGLVRTARMSLTIIDLAGLRARAGG